MQAEFNELGIYNIDVPYLKHLHDDVDSEVYYASNKYDTKLFLGIVIGIGAYTYFIPYNGKWDELSEVKQAIEKPEESAGFCFKNISSHAEFSLYASAR